MNKECRYPVCPINLKKLCLNLSLISLLVISMFMLPLTLMIPQASAAGPTTVLTPKWTRTGLGTNWESGLVIGDVTGDGAEDVVFGGGGNNIIYVLDGITGATIATYANSRIGHLLSATAIRCGWRWSSRYFGCFVL